MRSNKLRLAALAMSFVMAATAVPSVAFAEDLFTSDEAVSEEVAFDDGAEFVEEPVVDFVEPEAVEEFDEFYETAPIADSKDATKYHLIGENVHFFYKDDTRKDFEVTYNPSKVDDDSDFLYDEDQLLVDEKGASILATKVNEKETVVEGKCTPKVEFYLQVTITFNGQTETYVSKDPFTIEATDHKWKEPAVKHTVASTCTAQGYIVPDQQCEVCGKWRYAEDSAYAATVEDQKETLDYAEHTPAGGPLTRGYYVNNENYDPTADPAQDAYNSELDENGKPQAVYPWNNWQYQIVDLDTCTVCGEKFPVKVIETVTVKGIEYGTPYIGNVKGIENDDLEYDGSSSNYLTIGDDEIELTNCFKAGSYDVLMLRYDRDKAETVEDLIKHIEVPAPHHTPEKIKIQTADGKTDLAVIDIVADKVNGKKAEDFQDALKVGLSVVYTTDGDLIVTNLSCKDPYKYKEVVLCSHNEDKDNKTVDAKGNVLPNHEISSVEKEAPANGPHIIDDATKKAVEEFIKDGDSKYTTLEDIIEDYHIDKDPTKEEITDEDGNKSTIYDNLYVSLRHGTADCEKDGTVFVDYSCLVCNKVIETQEVNVKALGHDPAEKATVENYVKPTCTEDGSYDANIYCERCNKVVSTKKVVVDRLGHDYGNEYVLGHIGELIVGSAKYNGANYKVGDPVRESLGYDRVVYLLAGAVCKRCGKTAIENEERVYIDVPVFDEDDEVEYYRSELNSCYKPADGIVTKIVPGPHYCEENLLTVEASFEDKGNKQTDTWTFTYYKDRLEYQGRTPHEPLPAVQENVVPSTETTEGSFDSVVYCKLCGHEISRTPVTTPVSTHEHTWEKKDAKEATCTEDGNKEYYFCEACGSYSLDGVEVCAQEETIVKADHKYEEVVEVPATCTEAGVKAHVVCSVCGKKFIADEEAGEFKEVESDDELVAEALGHELEKVESKAPTATEEGNIEYYVCTRCGKLFSDAEGTTETTEEEVKLPKLELPAKVTGVKTNAYPSDVYPSKGFMKVTWTAVEGADDYRVSYRALGETAWTKVLTGGANSITLDETALTVGTSYEIRVAAGKEGVFGPRSDVLRRYYESVTPKYTRTSDSISVTWPAVEKGSSYMVIYSENKSMKPYKTIIVRNGILSATLKNLKAGTKYYVRVRPYDKTGKTATGALSPLKCVTTKK